MALRHLALIAATAGTFLGAVPVAADGAVTPAERRMVELTNRYRASWGLSRLRVDPHLQDAAQWFAADKARTGRFDRSHNDSLGRLPDERYADFDYEPSEGWTENLAAGSASPEEVFEAWRQSRFHDVNLRRRDARAIGVGLAINPRNGIAVWVADYGVHLSSAGGSASAGSARSGRKRCAQRTSRGRCARSRSRR